VANLPEEWKKLFKAANISDSELADPTTAAMIVNLLSHEQEKGSHVGEPAKTEVCLSPFFSQI